MNIEKLENSRKKVVFDVTAEEFESALDKAFEICNAKVTIKGFRAGKAPRHVYEKNYGVESLYDEALNVVLNSKASEIYADAELAKEICGQLEPDFESEERLERGKGFKVSLSFDVYPEVNLPQYKGIEVAKANTEVTAEELEAEVKKLAQKDASMQVKAEQVIEKGDYATFDFVGSVDGVEFPGGTAENYELQIGSGQFIPGFEDQMIGMKAEEVKDVNVTFPENYGEASLAGKAAVFKVTVHEVKTQVYPEINDEYVKGLNIDGVSTVEELKNKKSQELADQKAKAEKDRQVDDIVNKILDNAVVDMPASLVNSRIASIRGQYENQAKMYNIPFDTFIGLMGVTKEVFETETEKQGKRQALFNVIAEKIIEVEKLAPSKEALEEKAQSLADAQGVSKEEILKKNAVNLYNELAYTALIDFLFNNAKLV